MAMGSGRIPPGRVNARAPFFWLGVICGPPESESFSALHPNPCLSAQESISVAVILGGILGPIFYFISQEWCILFGGVIAGTVAFFLGEKNDN